MKRTADRLRPLADLAGLKGREAALKLAQSFSELQRAERELAQLKAYLNEYRAGRPSTAGLRPGRLENDRVFAARLAEAIEIQTRAVGAIRARHEAAVADWQRAYRHDRALCNLLDSYYRRERDTLERAEAESLDELMQRWFPAGRH